MIFVLFWLYWYFRGLFWSISDNKNSSSKSFISILKSPFFWQLKLLWDWFTFLVPSESKGTSPAPYADVIHLSRKSSWVMVLFKMTWANFLLGSVRGPWKHIPIFILLSLFSSWLWIFQGWIRYQSNVVLKPQWTC